VTVLETLPRLSEAAVVRREHENHSGFHTDFQDKISVYQEGIQKKQQLEESFERLNGT
jgi:hypothetical protein